MKKNIPLLIITLGICLLGVEIAFRINGLYSSYTEKRSIWNSYWSPFSLPDTNGYYINPPFSKTDRSNKEFKYVWVANEDGLKEKPIRKEKRGVRIMIFGDSFVEGIGAPNDSCYPRLLEKLLRANIDSSIEVINCGLSGADLFSAYELLKNKMVEYKPDLVLVTFNCSDVYDFQTRGGFERFTNGELHYRKPPWYEPFYAHSYIVRRIVHDVFHYDWAFLKASQSDSLQKYAFDTAFPSAVDSFNNLCAHNFLRFAMVFHPLQEEVRHWKEFNTQPLINFCQSRQIPYADSYIFLKQHNIDSSNAQSIYWPVDSHFKPAGYELLAQCVYEFIVRDSLLKKNSIQHDNEKTSR